jgi:hypothetical protein
LESIWQVFEKVMDRFVTFLTKNTSILNNNIGYFEGNFMLKYQKGDHLTGNWMRYFC